MSKKILLLILIIGLNCLGGETITHQVNYTITPTINGDNMITVPPVTNNTTTQFINHVSFTNGITSSTNYVNAIVYTNDVIEHSGYDGTNTFIEWVNGSITNRITFDN